MSESSIEKNKLENIDLMQIEYFSDLPISKTEVIVMEYSNPMAITIRKFLTSVGFEDVYICKEIKDGIRIFSDFINKDESVPIIIDDNISYENIKRIVNEVFEIQPNAKIIIITAKEKNDIQITELLSAGISSVIQKPLSLQSFKNVVSYIFENNDQDQGIMAEQSFEFIRTASERISQNKIQDILKTSNIETESLIKKSSESRNIILETEILEAACNQCNSTNITYTAECPNCKGINFKQQNLIEHYYCGEVFPKEPNITTCPKCNKEIGSVGTDYREFSDYYVCNSCNDRFPKPLSRFNCLDCNNFFIEKLAVWKKSKIYRVQN